MPNCGPKQLIPLHIDGAKCYKVGVHEKWTYGLLRALYVRVWQRIRSVSLTYNKKKLNLGLAEMQFPAVLRGLLALFGLFLVNILSRSQFLPLPLTISTQIWTDYETHIF